MQREWDWSLEAPTDQGSYQRTISLDYPQLSSNESPNNHSYLLQRLSVAVQRANAVSVMGTLSEPSTSDLFFLT